MHTYWVANYDVAPLIIKKMKERKAVYAKARKLAKKLGLKCEKLILCESMFSGSVYIEGWKLSEEPDRKLFVPIRGVIRGWKPRAGTELKRELDSFYSNATEEIHDILGLKIFDASDASTRQCGLDIIGKDVYIECPHRKHPKNCQRITDIEYEQATKPWAKRCKKSS